MKKIIRKFLILTLMPAFIIAVVGILTTMSKAVNASSEYYVLGDVSTNSQRLEAEKADEKAGKVSTPSVGTKACFVSGSILELSATGGSAKYNVNMENAGNYTIKIAYFTGDSAKKPAFSVTVNDAEPIVTSTLLINGWATAGEVWTYYINVNVELKLGSNTITILQDSNSTGYINLDFIEIYKSDSVFYYPVESKLYPELAGNFEIGERIEAEWMSSSAALGGANNTTNINPISGKILQLNAYTATFKVDVETAGTYAMKFAYYTGTNNSNMKFVVTANDSSAVNSATLKVNGWSSGGNIATYYTQVNIELKSGTNTISIKQGGTNYYINFDFVEIYDLNNVKYYPIEKNLYPEIAGANLVGERIEAESGFNTSGSGRSYVEVTGSNISGSLMWLGTSPQQYSVYAEEAGQYYLQIANNSSGELGTMQSISYSFSIGERKYNFTDFKVDTYGTGNDNLQSVHYFEVELEKGINIVKLESISATNKMRTDFIKFFKKTDNINRVGQFEDYAVGNVKVLKSEQKYEEIDEFAAEFNAARAGEILVPVNASKADYYDLYVRTWCGSADASFDLSINNGEIQACPVGNTGWVSAGGVQQPIDNLYRIYLNEGSNTLKFTKNSSAYVDFDWFYITEEKLLLAPNYGDGFKISVNDELILSDSTVTIEDSTIASVAGGKVVGLKGGATKVCISYTMDNGYIVERTYNLTVEKIDYQGSDLIVSNQVIAYDGVEHKYDAATAPEGWSIVYSNNDGLTIPDSKEVTIKFVHDAGIYNDVLMTASLTVIKGTYEGADLIVEDVVGIYDGTTEYKLEATAPENWDINYSTNGRVIEGVTTVTVIFSHPYYNDVTKSATITVRSVAKAVAASVSLEGDLALNFYFNIIDEVFNDEKAKLVFTVDGASVNVSLSEGVKNGEYYVFSYRLAAKDYKRVVSAKIETALGVCDEKSCSIESYADYVEANKENETYAKCASLVASMRDYCEAARVYFNNENTEEKFTEVTKDKLADYALNINGELPSDVKLIGATLVLETKTSIRIYFSATETTLEGAKAVEGLENVYYLEVNNIVAKELSTVVVFEIGDCQVSYSALSYAYSVLNYDNSSTALKNVVKALYRYTMFAREYWSAEA